MGRTALRQPGGVALVAEPVRERAGMEGLAPRADDERQMLARRGLEDLAQIGVHRDGELGAGLALLQVQNAVADMLAAHVDDIAATLRGVEQQREREPRLASDRMVR